MPIMFAIDFYKILLNCYNPQEEKNDKDLWMLINQQKNGESIVTCGHLSSRGKLPWNIHESSMWHMVFHNITPTAGDEDKGRGIVSPHKPTIIYGEENDFHYYHLLRSYFLFFPYSIHIPFHLRPHITRYCPVVFLEETISRNSKNTLLPCKQIERFSWQNHFFLVLLFI